MTSEEQTPRVTRVEDKKDQKISNSPHRVQPWKAFLGNPVKKGAALSASGPDNMIYMLKNGIQDNGVAS